MAQRPDITACPRDRRAGSPRRAGFTLVEMLVVITVIVLAMGIALPTVVELVTSGAQEQAYNVLAAQLASARALAIRDATYAGVHVQPADQRRVADGELPANTMYASVVRYRRDYENPKDSYFDIPDGFDPTPLPGQTAFGEISDDFVTPDGTYRNGAFDGDRDVEDFTTYDILEEVYKDGKAALGQ